MDLEDPETYKLIQGRIERQLLTPDIIAKRANQFLQAQGRGSREEGYDKPDFSNEDVFSRDALLLTCAACGVRNFDLGSNKRTYGYMRIRKKEDDDQDTDHLEFLKLSPEQTEQHICNIKSLSGIEIQLDEDGRLGTEDVWKAWSIYPQCPEAETFYHLHPEYVEVEKGRAMICSECKSCITKGNKPQYSLASGLDYGSYQRLESLTELTLMERHILAKVRLHTTAVKIESNTGRQRCERYLLIVLSPFALFDCKSSGAHR